MKPIWIVDDDQSIRFVLEKALLREDLPTRSFTNPREVLQALESGDDEDGPQILVSDIRMPGGSGLDLLTKVKEKHPGLPVIIMTAFSDLDSAVSAFQGGAFEYLPKPFDLPKAIELIRRAVDESQREEVAEERMAAAPEMLGQAPAMQDVFRAIGRLSQSNVTVMITGESGSGKELVARALHKHSPARAARSWRSIPPPYRKTCWSPSCSATSAAPLPARRPCGAGASSRPRAARCSSTKSATCRSICRRASCACCRTRISIASAATTPSRPTCV
jgi:DNA-binding NtrC family response regulator